MKKIVFTLMAVVLVASVAVYAWSNDKTNDSDGQVARWEDLAQRGDTAAMHRLIEFYDENSTVYVEVEAIYDENGNELPVDSINLANITDAELTKHYADRLDYWLDKGVANNDPVAIATKGLWMYYNQESDAIVYLSKAADAGNARAALFCGSACWNQGYGDDAFRYLMLAYRLGEPSAGWHLAMCYFAGVGTESNQEKAIEVMRHAAILNYPEAVSEMLRIEPDNEIWRHKADSLEIDSHDFQIISDE